MADGPVYHWHPSDPTGSCWEIREGQSLFLIAQGSGYSQALGLQFLAALTNEDITKT